MDISPINTAEVNSSIGKARFDNLKRIAKASTAKKAMDVGEKAKLAKAARGFESMFVHMMIKEMKSAMLKENKDAENFGADTLSGYTDMLWADDIANTGNGIGIAEKIYSQLTGGEKMEAVRVINNQARTFGNVQSNNIQSNNIQSNNIQSNDIQPNNIKSSNNKVDNVQSNNIQLDNSSISAGNTFMSRLMGRLSNYDDYISGASERYNVQGSLIKAIITAESAGKFDAVSKAGAKGLMQLMDTTAAGLGVDNSFDPKQNIYGGTSYISKMMERFGGDIDLALAAYNAGPGNVIKYDGVPPFQETKAYISRVKKYQNMFLDSENI